MDAAAVADGLGAEVSVEEIAGGHRFRLTRGECAAKFDLQGDTINWVSLSSPGEQGWLDAAVAFVKAVGPEHGVKRVTADGGTDRATGALERRGFKRDGRLLVLKLKRRRWR